MDHLLSGKAKAAAKRRQKKWRLSPDEWDTLTKLCDILKVCVLLMGMSHCTDIL
jgi:hypothetical protein